MKVRKARVGGQGDEAGRTKPLFRRVASFDNLNDTRAERLDRWCMVGEDTHITSRRGKIHLHNICGRENGLVERVQGADWVRRPITPRRV